MGYCPSKEELSNPNIVKLAHRLVGDSRKETLTNILEWQDRNIVFWSERWLISMAFWVSLVILGAAVAASFTARLDILSRILFIAPFGVPFVTSAILMFVFVHFNSGLPIKENLNALWLGCLSIEHIFQNRMAVCRDYAKLTACLLSNIPHDGKIYISSGSIHVATGIMLDKKLYILDQHLPIYTIDNINKWKKLGFESIVCLQEGKWKRVPITSVLSNADDEQIDSNCLVQLIAKRIAEMLNVKADVVNKENPSTLFKSRWRSGVIKYVDEEVVNYSMMRALSNKMLNNRVTGSQISIEISLDHDDIIFNFKMLGKDNVKERNHLGFLNSMAINIWHFSSDGG